MFGDLLSADGVEYSFLYPAGGGLLHLSTGGVFTVSSLFSSSNKLMDHNPRRGSTLTRKQHASPAFQPPLPPVEAAGSAGGQPVAELLLQQPTSGHIYSQDGKMGVKCCGSQSGMSFVKRIK